MRRLVVLKSGRICTWGFGHTCTWKPKAMVSRQRSSSKEHAKRLRKLKRSSPLDSLCGEQCDPHVSQAGNMKIRDQIFVNKTGLLLLIV